MPVGGQLHRLARVDRDKRGLGEALRLKFVGDKDNRQAVGAVLEVRTGRLYTRRYLRGDAATVGIGGADTGRFALVAPPDIAPKGCASYPNNGSAWSANCGAGFWPRMMLLLALVRSFGKS